jgi:hypothetical protein
MVIKYAEETNCTAFRKFYQKCFLWLEKGPYKSFVMEKCIEESYLDK